MQCDQCGRVFKSSQMQLRWDGAWVDRACFEIRQPQDYVKAVPDYQAAQVVRWRPPLTTSYLSIPTGVNRAQLSDGPIPTYGNYVEVYAKVSLLDWSPSGNAAVIYSQSRPGAGRQSFYVSISTAGAMQFTWTPASGVSENSVSTANLSATPASTILYLKWILSLGTASTDAFFYTSTDGETYVQLGAPVNTPGASDILSTGTPPTIGAFAGGAVGGDAPTDIKIYNVYVNGQADSFPKVEFNADLGAPGARSFQAGAQTYQLIGTDITFVTP